MIIGTLTVPVHLHGLGSIKDKRKIVKSLIERLKSRFNASVSEIEALDNKRLAVIGIAVVSNEGRFVEEQMDTIVQFIQQDGRFDDTSVWVEGERRLVTLKGCVQSQAQSEALEKAVWLVDDVMGVINLLQVGTDAAAARYPLALPQKP